MTVRVEQAYIGLGSNLDNPIQHVSSAINELDALPDTHLLANSPLYRSSPLGPAGQPDYVNAVAVLETEKDALSLLDALQSVEQHHGRLREQRWGPRTLDLDLLLFGEQVIDSPRLTVPHREIANRTFVLVPLHDVTPDLALPGLGMLSDLVKRCGDHGLQRLT